MHLSPEKLRRERMKRRTNEGTKYSLCEEWEVWKEGSPSLSLSLFPSQVHGSKWIEYKSKKREREKISWVTLLGGSCFVHFFLQRRGVTVLVLLYTQVCTFKRFSPDSFLSVFIPSVFILLFVRSYSGIEERRDLLLFQKREGNSYNTNYLAEGGEMREREREKSVTPSWAGRPLLREKFSLLFSFFSNREIERMSQRWFQW